MAADGLTITIVKERVILAQGYFRARLTLKNGDFCDLVEFFTVQNKTCVTESYRYQWMDATKQQLHKMISASVWGGNCATICDVLKTAF